MTFLKQVVPRDPKIFMYCIMVNIKIDGFREETKVLSGLQQLRGSVVTGYAALYTVMGDISRSKSEESMDRLIETLSGGEGGQGYVLQNYSFQYNVQPRFRLLNSFCICALLKRVVH